MPHDGAILCAPGKGEGACSDAMIDGEKFKTTCSVFKMCVNGAEPSAVGGVGFSWCENDFNDNPFELGGGYFSYDNFLQVLILKIDLHHYYQGWTTSLPWYCTNIVAVVLYQGNDVVQP